MENVATMVEENVLYNANEIVSHLISEKYEDWAHMLSYPDWEESAMQYVFNQMAEDELCEFLRYKDQHHDHIADGDLAPLRKCVWLLLPPSCYEDFCVQHELDPEPNDIYEYWIVTDWLANRLEQHGQVIERSFYGLTIWGRQTTGQAIFMDSVIINIHQASNQRSQNLSPYCAQCGGSHIVLETTAEWNFKTQCAEVIEIAEEDHYCVDCNGFCNLDWK